MKLLEIELDPKRIYGLDIIRAAAIIFVMIHHTQTLIPKKWFDYIEPFIFDGVGVFFVLSGFLIGGILIKILDQGAFTINRLHSFWIRRWFRTLPNYLLVLIILIALNFIFKRDAVITDKLSYFIFSQNLFTEHPVFFPEAWSLSVEEWFYLIIPFSLFCLGFVKSNSSKKNIAMISISIILMVTLYRFFKFSNLDIDASLSKLFARQVFTRLDSLMYGVLGAFVYYYYSSYWFKYRKIALLLSVVLYFSSLALVNYFESPFYYCVFSFTITSLITLLSLPFFSNIKKGKGVFYKMITYISLTSYSIYLINFSLIKFWILNNIDFSYLSFNNGYLLIIIKIIIFWLLTIGLSILLFKYYELPMTGLRDRFKKV